MNSKLHFRHIIRFLLPAVLLLSVLPLQAVRKPAYNLDSLYRCLDNAIDSSRYYINVREQRINRLKRDLQTTTGSRGKLRISFDIYEEYKVFKNDSAMLWLKRCISLAAALGDRSRENDCLARLALQNSTAGFYHEAFEILNMVDTSSLDNESLHSYVIAGLHLYNELYRNATLPALKEQYGKVRARLLRQLFTRFSPDDDEYMHWLLMEYLNAGDIKNALRVSDRWLKLVEPGSHEFAIAAYFRYRLFRRLKDENRTRYWLLESSLSDVRNAVMDQGAILELVSRSHSGELDIERSYKYICFAWTSAQMFHTRMRSILISPIFSLIERNYQAHVAAVNLKLRLIIGVVCVLLAAVGGLLFFVNRQRHRLQTARNELGKSNLELKELNRRLSEYNERQNLLNEQLAQTNSSLDESNKMKELYIGRFLSLCSTYIERTETLRHSIQKRVKNKDYDGLVRLATDKKGEWDEFYNNFDSAFLKLFPDFVEDFNALLRPEERVSVSKSSTLGTILRIYALIRLGIDDSLRIARFLHYSINTIYNYRTKMKNCALCDRNEFENRVRQIGMK